MISLVIQSVWWFLKLSSLIMSIEQEKQKEQIQELKRLYINIAIYLCIFLLSIVVWFGMSFYRFWPIWVFIGFAVASLSQAIAIGQGKKLEDILPFLNKEWEEKQLKKLSKAKEVAFKDNDQ